jgi:hypothetical protein
MLCEVIYLSKTDLSKTVHAVLLIPYKLSVGSMGSIGSLYGFKYLVFFAYI